MKPVGKPDAGNRHVRFDERGWETGRRSASVPAPNLDSTGQPSDGIGDEVDRRKRLSHKGLPPGCIFTLIYGLHKQRLQTAVRLRLRGNLL